MSAALAAYFIRPARASMTGAPIVLPPPAAGEGGGGLSPRNSFQPFAAGIPADISGTSPGATGLPLLAPRAPGVVAAGLLPPAGSSGAVIGVPSKSLDQESGEYRGIMALCR